MATIQEQQLGQVRNTLGGTAESAYSPGASETAIIKSITVCNNTGSADSYSIFLDDDGTTYSEETCLFFDQAIAANETHILSVYWPMNNSAGNLAVEAATTDAVTFTVFGAVITA
jgi:hypothetical protein